MDILRKASAPINADIWEEIENQARDLFKTTLTARQVVDVSGPHGWSLNALSLGRLEMPKKQPEVNYGIYKVQPLVEARIPFVLSRWELDNLVRGARDIDLEPVVEAAKKIAAFEEKAIYEGLAEAGIVGLLQSAATKPAAMPADAEKFLTQLANSVQTFKDNGIVGPYSLVINPEKWQALATAVKGYPLIKHLSSIITGKVVLSPAIKGMVVLSERGGDFEMTLGADLSVGYENHDHENITFCITESFTFRVIEPRALVVYQ
jgi:uncharacterized linocin/CFP29 family protein